MCSDVLHCMLTTVSVVCALFRVFLEAQAPLVEMAPQEQG